MFLRNRQRVSGGRLVRPGAHRGDGAQIAHRVRRPSPLRTRRRPRRNRRGGRTRHPPHSRIVRRRGERVDDRRRSARRRTPHPLPPVARQRARRPRCPPLPALSPSSGRSASRPNPRAMATPCAARRRGGTISTARPISWRKCCASRVTTRSPRCRRRARTAWRGPVSTPRSGANAAPAAPSPRADSTNVSPGPSFPPMRRGNSAAARRAPPRQPYQRHAHRHAP